MTEFDPLNAIAFDIAWKAAQEANHAHDVGDMVSFELLGAIAAPAMLMRDSPYDVRPAETVSLAMPSFDSETNARFETLAPAYRRQLVERYAVKLGAVSRQIEAGILPEIYRLPELGSLLEQIRDCAPVYDAMEAAGWEPGVVFVPKGLELEQWDALLKGHDLGGNRWSEGVYRTWAGYELFDEPTRQLGNLWEIAIISEAERPQFVNVSKNAQGSGAQEAVHALERLPNLADQTSPETIIATGCPTEEMYFALQLGRLERYESPVDLLTWTMGRSDVNVAGGRASLYFNYGQRTGQARSVWNEMGFSFRDDGIRPAVASGDLIAVT